MRQVLDLRETVPALAFLLSARPAASFSLSELRSVLSHRDSVLDHLAVTLRAGTRVRRRTRGDVTAAEVAEHPVEALLGLLRSHPRTRERIGIAPTDRFGQRPAHQIEAAWHDLDRILLIAAHDWHTAPAAAPPDVQWGLVADVAAITLALTRLDADLLAAARTHQLQSAESALASAQRSPLRLAARESKDLALQGHTHHSWTIPAPADRSVILLHGLHQLADGAEQLARMLHDPRLRLTAADTLTVLAAHAHASLALGRVLRRGRADLEQPGELLEGHGRALVQAAREAHGRLGSFTPRCDLHVVHQANEIHRCVADTVPAAGPPHQPAIEAAQAFAEHAHATTSGITALLVRGVHSSGRWVTIDHNAVDLRWRLTTRHDLTSMFTRLDEAFDLIAPHGPAVLSFSLSKVGRREGQLNVGLDVIENDRPASRPELPRRDLPIPASPSPITADHGFDL